MNARLAHVTWLLVLLAFAIGSLLRQPSAGALTVRDGAIYVIPIPTARATSVPLAGPVRARTGRPALVPRGDYPVRGTPTISVALINQVLAAYGSPLAGQGQALYDLGVKYDVDPAFCLAFFVEESDAGTRGEAVLTHSVGNLRPESGTPSLDGYRYYDTWLEGAEDWYRLIRKRLRRQLGPADPRDHHPGVCAFGRQQDVTSYIHTVEQLVATWRAESAGGARIGAFPTPRGG